ncbi:GtrA family protein [Clostridium saccharoperbutylacetonicum]|uniref:GtrA family protein n=1 Tax=Clostridium saccharoperbutylacetonicum TaxID=36745 RepID=UPI000983E7B6|nr:GtrA family protein [Clostridium saccharoperbutylacetonicum]AQR97832.1 GtrA-like protein [Clostridium saccharoperbutylacetonicum]NSB33724.1 putative flippase GtrA [Clostridium saccharoperbutylacetonicum]
MKKFFLIFFDISFLKFLIIGGFNCILSIAIMFSLYNLFGLGYWGSSMVSFTICSVISYVLNRKISFNSSAPLLQSIIKFSIVIAVSYFIAFGVARPIVTITLRLIEINISKGVIEQLAMILAQGIFTIFNFIGQKMWTFR